jgi:hypothetical protein
MVRRTCTAIAVLAQADTQLSPMGVTWGSAALGPCSLHIGSQEPPVRHGLIVLRWPQKRAANAISPGSKKAKQGRRENRTRVKPSTRVFRPTPIAPKTQNPRPHPRRPGTGPTSAPTSAARPLICYSEFLERSPKNTWFCTIRPKCAQFNKKHGFRKKPKVVMLVQRRAH